jgi:hypothetical protein
MKDETLRDFGLELLTRISVRYDAAPCPEARTLWKD